MLGFSNPPSVDEQHQNREPQPCNQEAVNRKCTISGANSLLGMIVGALLVAVLGVGAYVVLGHNAQPSGPSLHITVPSPSGRWHRHVLADVHGRHIRSSGNLRAPALMVVVGIC